MGLLRRVGDLLGTSGDKLLKLVGLIGFEFSGCLSRLALECSRFGLDVSQLRIVPGFRRLYRRDVVIHELSVGLDESINVRIAEGGQIVGQRAGAKCKNRKRGCWTGGGNPKGPNKNRVL